MTTRALPKLLATLALALAACVGRAAADDAPAPAIPPDDGKTLKVCGDPNNLPFSNDKLEGIENKIADVIAKDLGRTVVYTWWPHQRGVVKRVLNLGRCDVMLGIPKGYDPVLWTKPYYRTGYVMAYRKDRKLKLRSLDDPQLKTLKIGVQVNTPPHEALAQRGIADNVEGYQLMFDSNYHAEDYPGKLIEDLLAGSVDVALVWGPIAGYFATKRGADARDRAARGQPRQHHAVRVRYLDGRSQAQHRAQGQAGRSARASARRRRARPSQLWRTAAPGHRCPGCRGRSPTEVNHGIRLVICGALLLAACNASSNADDKGSVAAKLAPDDVPPGTNPFAKHAEAVVEGRKIYLKYGCSACHGVGGGGGMGKPLIDDEWRFGSDDQTLFKLVRGEIPNQTMPTMIGKAMTDEEIWKVLTYVRSIYAGDQAKINWVVPPPVSAEMLAAANPRDGDPLTDGKQIFWQICTPCHGPDGHGDGPAAATLNPKPRNLTDAEYMKGLDDRYMFELISRGGISQGKSPMMPAQPSLTAQDLNNVVAYVRSLSAPRSQARSP